MTTIFISDTHLGSGLCKSDKLLEFLVYTKADKLYLVGDTIDDHLWETWPSNDLACLYVMHTFPEIIYIPGNHDSFARQFTGQWDRVHIRHEDWYQTADGKVYWIVHGDEYDNWIKYTKWISTSIFGQIGRKIAHPIHDWLVKSDSAFTRKIINCTIATGFNGVICGHSHLPEIKQISGIQYMNTGDWVDHCTAIIEKDGKFELVSFK